MTAAESHPPPIPVSSELHEFLEQAVSENKARYEKEANKKSLWDVGNQVVLLVPLLFNYLVAGFYKTLLISWMIHCSVDVLQKVTKQNTTWPPALLALGVLTIISLIVHPDGYTWVILQQLRNGIMMLLENSSTCWAVAVNDYGTIVCAVVALTTFACLFGVVYVLHKTLTPKSPKPVKHPEKKKRKKKHHHPRKNNRIKQRPKEPEHETERDFAKALFPLVEDQPVVSPPVLEHQEQKEDPIPLRARASTVDSATSSVDDQSSCGTPASGRSTPTSGSSSSEHHPSVVTAVVKNDGSGDLLKRTTKTVPNRTSSSSGRTKSNRKNNNKKSNNESSSRLSKDAPLIPSKRWDALKPTANDSRRVYAPPKSSTRRGQISVRDGVPPRSSTKDRTSKPQSSVSQVSAFEGSRHGATLRDRVDQSLLQSESASLGKGKFGVSGEPISMYNAAKTPERTNTEPSKAAAFSSELNPESPSFDFQGRCGGVPLRPPPGLTRSDIPFGCSSSEFSSPTSPFVPESTAGFQASTFLSGLPDSYSRAPPPSSSFGAVKQNPFENDDEEQIEAELQELGGQMVGSILDF